MAKTWRDDEDIVRQVENRDYATHGAMASLMSDDDYGQSLYNSKLWESADEAGRTALHDQNEKIKAKYGFSGGVAGNEYIKLDKPSYQNIMSDAMQRMANYGQYIDPYREDIAGLTQHVRDYGTFTDPYQAGIDAKYNAIINRSPFEYDYTTDPRWQAYKKEYTREGRRATEDTLGQYAAMTGGMPSTAAMTAASQAGDYYNAKLTDKIPELYQLAYDMYAADAARDLSDLNAIRGLSGDAYGRWVDGYNRLGNALNVYQNLSNTDYGRWTDEYGRLGDIYNLAYGERGYADQREDAEQNALLDKAAAAAALGDFTLYQQLGINPDPDALLRMTLASNGRSTPIGSGGSGGSGGGGGKITTKPDLTVAQVNQAIKNGIITDKVKEAYEYYYGEPYPEDDETGSGEPSVDTVRENGRLDNHDVMHSIRDSLGFDSAADNWDFKNGDNLSLYGNGYIPMADLSMDASGYAPDGDYPVNMDSVNNLGFGPISAQYLSDLVNNGQVVKYLQNGEWHFRRA